MQLVVGGAYSGKRKFVNREFPDCQWLSAYENQSLDQWKLKFKTAGLPVVIEGWEVWIREEREKAGELESVRNHFESILSDMHQFEKQTCQPIILIMLEMGRGVVPMAKGDRAWRDLSGWILQAAADKAESVHYCWHGLSRKLK
ncbi:bifunctional adenosylcobinamide kinase/adenosylcobinamide-phosphate guanylyltransferase [Thalassobacillus devorans]|uniref:bifunctional adenosylcobinamide kinase/adenosylcobinamide-phosphate guanylyltransferase n=1 Tax=Thalassobacillus devorans TaxID=279813 RepID=UPI000490221D|nr:bifunctional adenosylcobinamide kinase/adenosylcobinamide-phosphate guanylyltransferase [Thalassobacillus devorans]